MVRTLLVTLVLSSSMVGCAGYKLTPISPEEAANAHNGSNKEGYIFHAPQPFLMGTQKAGGAAGKPVDGYEFQIVYLPDPERPYRFTRYEFFAKSDLKINFEDGWKFTGAESSTDTTSALTALVDLAKGAVGLLNVEDQAKPGVVLFRINAGGPEVLEQVYPPKQRG